LPSKVGCHAGIHVGVCFAQADNIVWVNTSGGNWSDDANWDPQHAPGASDTAIITSAGNYTVTLDVSTTVAGLVLGTTNAGSTQILSINGQTFTLSGLAVVNSSGQFDLSSGTFEGDTNSGGAIFDGTLTCSGGTLSGVLTFASNAVVNLIQAFSMPVAFNTLVLTNLGTVNWVNTDLQGTSAQIFNYGLWEAQTNNTFFGGNGGTTFNNFCVLRKSGGDRDSGSTDFDSQTTFNNPGTVDCQVGQLAIGGAYTLAGGRLIFSINSSNNFGSLYLAGNATLTGALSANFANGYSPVADTSFPLVSYGSETGIFTTLSLPHLSPGLVWQTNYGSTTFTLIVTSAPPTQLSVAMTEDGGTLSLTWNAIVGQTYQLQYTTNLAPANWLNLGDTVTATNDTMTVSEAIGQNPQRFYRLVLVWLP
jgi:hypothetical protein